MELNKKAQAIKDHFYSVNLTRVDFERENFASYGFESQANFHRHLTRMGISVKSRSEHFKKNRPNAIIESSYYWFSSLKSSPNSGQ
jgi:hypothetical protein